MKKDFKKQMEEVQHNFSVNLTFLRVLRSYCQDETKMGSEIKDVLIALDEIIPRQEQGIKLLSQAIVD